jgi:hypothetical protein
MKDTQFSRFEDYVAHRLPLKAQRARAGSRKAAMDLQCWTCFGGESPRDCQDTKCWLWAYRPQSRSLRATKQGPTARRIDEGGPA